MLLCGFETLRFCSKNLIQKMNHQTGQPPSDMDQNETTSCVKCWTAFRHPPFARFGLWKHSEPFLRTSLDRLGAPSFALWTCTNFEQSRAKSVGRLHLTPLRSGDWIQKRAGLLCDLLDAPGPPPCAEREVCSIWKHPPVRFAGQDFLTLLRTLPPFAYLPS